MGPDGNSRKGLAHSCVTCHKPRNGSPTPFHNGGALPDPNHKSSGSPLPSPHAPARGLHVPFHTLLDIEQYYSTWPVGLIPFVTLHHTCDNVQSKPSRSHVTERPS